MMTTERFVETEYAYIIRPPLAKVAARWCPLAVHGRPRRQMPPRDRVRTGHQSTAPVQQLHHFFSRKKRESRAFHSRIGPEPRFSHWYRTLPPRPALAG